MTHIRRGMGVGSGKKGYYNLVHQDSWIHTLCAKGISTSIKPRPSRNIFALPIQTAIIVPSTKDVYKPISASEFKRRTNEVRNFLYKNFGGYTSVQGIGAVQKKSGGIATESVNVVYSYATRKDYLKNKKDFLKYAKAKKENWKQDSVGIIIENDLFFVS